MDSLVTCDFWLSASSVLGLEPHQLGFVSHPSLPQYRHTVLPMPASPLWERILFVFLKCDEKQTNPGKRPKGTIGK